MKKSLTQDIPRSDYLWL